MSKNIAVVKKIASTPAQEAPAVATKPSPTPIFEIRNEESHTDLVKAGFAPTFLDSAGERMISIHTSKGVLVSEADRDRETREVQIIGRIIGAVTLVAAAHDLKVVVIRTEVRTQWTFCNRGRLFSFFIAGRAENLGEAAVRLLENNLNRGKSTFEGTAGRVPFFFYELLNAAFEEDQVFDLTLRHEKLAGRVKLYFFKNAPDRAGLSVTGAFHAFDFKTHPDNLEQLIIRANDRSLHQVKSKTARVPLEQSSAFKPTQTKRADKKVEMPAEGRRALVNELHDTLQSVRERAHELNQPKKVRDMTIIKKQPKAKPDGGKKKKNGKK